MVRKTGHRVAAATLAAALLGGFLTGLTSLGLVGRLAGTALTEPLPRPGGPIHQRCLRDPEHFQDIRGMVETRAHDALSGRSSNLDTGSLESWSSVPQVGSAVVFSDRVSPLAIGVRVAEAGPCSLLVLRWPLGASRPGFMFRMGLIKSVVLIAVGLCLGGWVALPFLTRVRRLKRSAQSVGSYDYVSARDSRFPDLDAIAEALDEAHAEIRKAKSHMEARHAALEHHLRSVAHDVRTPLASLSITLETLNQHDPSVSASVRRAMDDVVYLGGLAENLALEARFRERQTPQRVPTDIEALVRRVVARYEALARRGRARVEAATGFSPLPTECDPVMIEQALGNLVHNALVHGGPEVTVTVVLDEIEEGFELKVVDDGPGLSDEASRAFRDRVRPMPSAVGTGRGLMIAEKAVALHGWKLRLDTSSEGTEVSIHALR